VHIADYTPRLSRLAFAHASNTHQYPATELQYERTHIPIIIFFDINIQ
jgi:hypothetical protein